MNEQLKQGIEEFKVAIQTANTHLNDKQHAKVEEIFNTWIDPINQLLFMRSRDSQDHLEFGFAEIEERIKAELAENHIEDFGLLGVGVLGLFSIYHVDSNNQLKENVIDEVQLSERLIAINLAYSSLPSAFEIPQSIHGSPAHWKLERRQHFGRSEELLGNGRNAITHYQSAIELADESLHTEKDEKIKAGILSGRAVNLMRQALLLSDQYSINEALDNQVVANKTAYNAERTGTLGKMAVKGSLTKWWDSEGLRIQPLSRLSNVLRGTGMILSSKMK